MSLKDTSSIDIVMKLPGLKKRLALLIVDSDQIEDADERWEALAQKLRVYLHHIVSGGVANSFAEAEGREIVIEVLCSYPPTEAMRQIDAVRSRQDPPMVVPVSVGTQEEFMAKLDRLTAEEQARPRRRDFR